MVVGPEAAGSLLVGTVVRSSVDQGHSGDEDDATNAAIAGIVTGMAGAVIFVAGLTRLGFLDSVLSRPFLRGFISAIGFVILADQLIPETGLTSLAKHVGGVSHGSSLDKIIFLVENVGSVHRLTCGVAFGSFAIIMVCRYVDYFCFDRMHCMLNISKAAEDIHPAKIPICGIRPGSLPCRCPFRSLHVEIRLGQARSTNPWRRSVKYRISLSASVAPPASSDASCTRSDEHLISHRFTGLLRIIRCGQKSWRWRKQAWRRHSGNVSQCQSRTCGSWSCEYRGWLFHGTTSFWWIREEQSQQVHRRQDADE